MPTHRKWLILLAGAVVAVMVFLSLRRASEPSYQGRSLSAWVVGLTNYNQDENQDKAADAIRQIGTNAIPYLVQYSRFTPWALRVKTAEVIAALAKRLGREWPVRASRNEARGEGAFYALGLLGPAAAIAIPDLTALTADPGNLNRASQAISTLGFMGAQGLPPLLAVLTNQQSPLRVQAALSLSRLGTNALPAVPVLIGYLRDPNENLARFSALSLGKLRQEPTLVVPALVTTLQDPRPRVRSLAAEAIGKFGDQATSAVPALLTLLNDTDRQTCKAASNALHVIAPEALTNAPAR